MAEDTKIEWADNTLNFWIGCSEVSPACDNCYARVQNEFRKWVNGWGPHGERNKTKTWGKADKWQREAAAADVIVTVFSNSLSDFFDNQVPEEWRIEAWKVIKRCPNLFFMILTKRASLIQKGLPADWGDGYPNVALGVTAENQEEAERRIPELLNVPAKVHFVSCEPLLGPIDLENLPYPSKFYGGGKCESCSSRVTVNALSGDLQCGEGCDSPTLPHLDWVIVGGESGSKDKRREMDLSWARGILESACAYGVAFFGKQLNKVDPLPADLMVRQFPDAFGKNA